ncbi:CHASE2 domain-containing protein, partial [Thermaurantiacus sp.]
AAPGGPGGPLNRESPLKGADPGPRSPPPLAPAASAAGHRQGLFAEWAGLLALASGLIALLTATAPFARFDNLVYDALLRAGVKPVSDRILIVAIDNRSVAELGRWPWPRARHVELLAVLAAAAPRAVGYDVLFTEPAEDPAEDRAIAAALVRVRAAVPYLIEVPGYDGRPSAVRLPAPPIDRAATLGHAMIRPDRDGVVRAIEPLAGADGRRLPHLADQVVALATGADPSLRTAIDGERIAPDPRGERRIRFRVGPSGYPHASFADVLAGRIPEGFLAGRIVLVGATASGIGDRFASPLSGRVETMAGVEVLANYIDGELAGDGIRVAPPLAQFAFALAPVLLLFASLLTLGPRINLWLGLALMLAVVGVSAALLLGANLWLPPAVALASVALIYPLWGWRRLDFANRYMAAELEELAREPAVLPKRRITPSGDPVERQVMLMHEAIADVRDLKRFVTESLDSLPDAALVTDLSGRIVIANDAADRLFAGRLEGPLVGRPLGDALGALHGRDTALAAEAADLLAAIEAGTRPPAAPREWRLADGTLLDLRLAFFTDSARKPLGWILRFVDLTALRDAERQREEALRLLTHDMRSPQASILALLDTEGERLPADLRRRIERYASQTLSLADQYVQFARAETAEPALQLLDLSEAMLDAVDDLWPLARDRGVRLEGLAAGEEMLVLGDRALLTRAIQNLVGNAIKYSPPGGPVTARVDRDDPWVRLEVEDEGRGIDPAELPSLFEPFRRLAAPEGAAGEPGAGLGLAFVKRVVERHGGEVFARSTPGVGSTFGFRLPRAGS